MLIKITSCDDCPYSNVCWELGRECMHPAGEAPYTSKYDIPKLCPLREDPTVTVEFEC